MTPGEAVNDSTTIQPDAKSTKMEAAEEDRYIRKAATDEAAILEITAGGCPRWG